MTPFIPLNSVCYPLPSANIDTDQLIPARFMKEPRSVGYGQFLLYDLRFDDNGQPITDFILNQKRMAAAQILIARRNFGAGSSREAAVYALVDYGFRCIVAPSFGDIFASNAINNGLLPAIVSESDTEKLLGYCEKVMASSSDSSAVMSVDLQNQVIRCPEFEVEFNIKPVWRTKLLNGWDDIDLTIARSQKIRDFYQEYQEHYLWAARPTNDR